MPAPLTREQFEKLTALKVTLTSLWLDQMKFEDPIMSLYNIASTKKAQVVNQGYGGLGDVPAYTGAIDYDGFELLYSPTYIPGEYAKGIAIERKLIDDDEYGVMNDRVSMLGISFDRTVIKFAASVFVNAFTASAPYLGPDGVALCSASHPNSPSDATTQGNTGTTALSAQAVIDTKKQMLRFKDSKANPVALMPDTLLVPLELEPVAQEIVKSVGKPDTANNNANVSQGAYRVLTSPFLTDTNNWFMIDSRLAKRFLRWYWRIPPELAESPDSDFNLVLRLRGYMRLTYGWDFWGWIYGHNVA
jgi:phage major head subunit gpT-like protein